MSFFAAVKRTVLISRPLFWPSTFFAFLLGVIFSRHAIGYASVIYACLWAFPYSLWMCAANDMADRATDSINPHKGGASGAKMKSGEEVFMTRLMWGSFFTIMMPTLFTGNILLIIASLLAVVIPSIYSSYPIRLKERPPFDSFSNGAFVVCVFLAGFVFYQPVLFDGLFFQAALGFFFGVAGIHVIAALRDYTPDKKANMRTIAIAWGQRRSAVFALLLFTLVYISIYRFPLEFRIYGLLGISFSLHLAIYPSERRSMQYCIILVCGFGLVALYSFIFQSWSSFF